MSRLRIGLLCVSLFLALAAATLIWLDMAAQSRFGTAAGDQAPIGGTFTLVDQNGHPRSDRDFHGRWMIVYFGYTFCPDVCPTTLQEIADAWRALGPRAGRFVPVFITLDPQRDTPAMLHKYLSAFGPGFIGLTGSMPQIASVAREYHVYYSKHPLPGGGYSVDHASTIYLMAPDGTFAALLDGSEGAPALAHDLRARL